MNRRGPWVLALALSLSATSCGGGGGAAAAAGATAPRSSNVISLAELEDAGIQALSVYDAIQRLRPTWLTSRGATSVASAVSRFPAVLINGSIDQNLDGLRSMRVSDAAELRFIDSRDATTRYGTGYVNGMIEVVVRSGR